MLLPICHIEKGCAKICFCTARCGITQRVMLNMLYFSTVQISILPSCFCFFCFFRILDARSHTAKPQHLAADVAAFYLWVNQFLYLGAL